MLSVGALLKSKREQKKLSLSDVEKAIKVREKFVLALEEDRWDVFTSKIYIAGILKNYSHFLGLDHKKVLAFFRREYERKEDVRFKKSVSRSYFSPDSKKAVWISFSIAILVFTSYFIFQVFQYVRPPQITLLSPVETTFKLEDAVKIVGKTEKEASITVQGERVYQNRDGIFEYMFPLDKQNNELIIDVVGANGKTAELKKILKKIK